MQMSATITKLSAALLKAQSKMGDATKGAKNPFFKSNYADLNSIREAAIPVLNAEAITVLQPTVVIEGRNYVRTLLLHESGEYLSSDTEIVTNKEHDAQSAGSGISYARRYGLQSFLNIGAVDDDGEAAMGRKTGYAQAAAPKPQSTSGHTLVVGNSITAGRLEATMAVAPVAAAMSDTKPANKWNRKGKITAADVAAANPAVISAAEVAKMSNGHAEEWT